MSETVQAIPPSPLPRPRGWWQFSMREIALLVLSVSAILALIVQQLPFHCTTFFVKLQEQKVIADVCGELGIPTRITSSGGGHMQGPRKGSGDWSLELEIPSNLTRAEFVTAFREHLLKRLAKEDCEMVGGGWQGDPAKKLTTDFSFDYEQGPAAGEVRVESADAGEGQISIRMWVIEFPR